MAGILVAKGLFERAGQKAGQAKRNPSGQDREPGHPTEESS